MFGGYKYNLTTSDAVFVTGPVRGGHFFGPSLEFTADSDGDGIPDADDSCNDTAPGAVIDAYGCSIDDYCPCDTDAGGTVWPNHGAYMSCVTAIASQFRSQGLITNQERGQAVATRAQNSCP